MGRYGYSHYRNNDSPGASLFITTTILDFATIFAEPTLADLMTASLLSEARKRSIRLAGFVVMPHHLHVLASMPDDLSGPQFVQTLKSISARRLLDLATDIIHAKVADQSGLNRRAVWKKGFRSYALSRDGDFDQKLRYIHQNPVRASLVAEAEEYRWSSAWMWRDGLAGDDGILVTDALIAHFEDGF